MRNKMVYTFAMVVVFFSTVLNVGCTNSSTQKAPQSDEVITQAAFPADVEDKTLVTFIELGSVRCIPCQQMMPIMDSIETKYGDQVEVVFHDVWTPEGKPFGEQYGIRAIPTQVFLDENGEEFFRHVGFFAQDELEAVLKSKGVK